MKSDDKTVYLIVRVKKDLRNQLKRVAIEKGMSCQKIVVELLEEYLKLEEEAMFL